MEIKSQVDELIGDGVLEASKTMTYDELIDENMQLKRAIAYALTNVNGWDRHKPFENSDMCGEMVSIRLTGLCRLAEIVRPGCRAVADARFLTGWEHPTDIEKKKMQINKIARIELTEVHGEDGWLDRVQKLAKILASLSDEKVEALSILLVSTTA